MGKHCAVNGQRGLPGPPVDGEDATRGRGQFVRRTALRHKGKGRAAKIRVVRRPRRDHGGIARMNPSEFLRIERESSDGSRHYVLHTHDPKFSMELLPDSSAPDKMGRGVIKRICVPNSWAGDYAQYAKFIAAAQDFFEQSFDEPAPKFETRRIAR
jgi:hypothetical protein